MTLNTTSPKYPVEIKKVIQTTPSQLEIWLACKLGGKEANMAYNESVSIQLTGNLCVKSLQAAFLKIIERHDGMRAIISPNGKQLMVLSSYELPIRLRDISELSLDDKKKFLSKHVTETGTYQFNLAQGPLYVMELIKLDATHHQLTFTGHHIIFDGWSLGVMLEELGSLYTSILTGKESTLEKADDLSDYSVELINSTRKSNYKETKKFWTQYLSNPVPDLKLPLDKQRPKLRTFPCEVVEVSFEEQLLAKSRAFSVKHKVSLNHTLLSIFEIFLSDWTQQSDVVVGLPVAGQLLMNRPSLIGHCVHLLPLRSKIDASQTFTEYLESRRRSYNETLGHQAISFGSMIQDLPIKRDLGRIPLVPITFNIGMGMDGLVAFEGLTHKLIPNPKAYANFEIIVDVTGSGDDNIFEWTYNRDLFNRDTIETCSARYLEFIEKILANPELKIADLINTKARDLSRADSEFSELEDFNNSDSHKTDFAPFGELILSNLEGLGDRVALNFEDQVYSYEAVGSTVKSFAGYLIQKGIGPGDIVGVNLDRSPELMFVLLGILQAGAGYLPIDLDFPEERVKFMLEDAGVECFFTDRKDTDWGVLASKKLDLTSDVFSEFAGEFRPTKAKADDPIFVIYTSGSTGVPKGVVLNQYNLYHFSKHYVHAPGIQAGDKILGLTSVSFDMHWMDLIMPFAYGAGLFLMNKYHRIDAREIIKSLERYEISMLAATPSQLRSLVNHGLSKRLTGLTIISAGEPLSPALADSLYLVCDSLFNIYGPSETTIFSNIKRVEPGSELITIGKPVPGSSVVIVDEDGNLIKETNKVGEILIGGTGVAKGYLNRPELNREKFIKAPFPSSNGRYYRSGDLGRWTEDGEIICLGRIDHQVKVRGQRVELGEIESKISMDEKVQNVAVLKFTEENGDDLLRAFVSIKEPFKSGFDPQTWIEESKTVLSKKVASYMVPGHYVVLDQLPLNSNGKIDRNILKNFSSATPKSAPIVKEQTSKLDDFEDRIQSLWEKVLQIQNAGKDDNFFEVGGHSLLAVDLISQIEKEFDLNLPLSILFEFPSIRSVAAQVSKLLNENSKSHSGSLVKIKNGDPKKVLLFVHGVGLNPIEITTLIQHMDKDQTIWGLQSPAIVDSTITPMNNLVEIASYYISQIKAEGLAGPYNLMGNSIGGLIAFEMANQLMKSGDRVNFLGMIDTVALQDDGLEDSIVKGIGTIFHKLLFEVEFVFDDFDYYRKFRARYAKEKWDNAKENWFKTKGSDLFSRIKQIERINMDAWKNYKHEKIDTKITLFLAKKRTFYVKDAKTFGWSSFVNEVETIKMPGDHAEMLKPPYGEEFSKALQHKLNTLS